MIIPLFHPIPVRVDLVSKDLKIIQTVYLLGDQSASVKKIISKEGIKSKKLKSRFDMLLSTTSIEGGIDWEDIDDEDFETMLNADVEPELATPDAIELVSSDTAKEIFNYDIIVYKEDTVLDLQRKIALVTNIEPYKQHLSMSGKSLTHHIEFKSSLDTNTDDLNILSFLQTTTTLIKNIPFDEHFLFSKESSNIVNTQSTTLNTFTSDDGLHITMVSIDSIIVNKETIQFLLRSDKQSFDTIYESFIERFFIMLDSQTFANYLNNNLGKPELSEYKQLILNQIQIINKLNVQPQVSATSKDLVITTNALTLRSKGTIDPMLSLVRLFNNCILAELPDVFYLDLIITTNNRLKQIRKVPKYASQAINFAENVSMNVKPLVTEIRSYRQKDWLVITLLPSSHCSKLIIKIDVFGQIEIVAYSCRSAEATKSSFVEEISTPIKSVIRYLNAIDEAYFNAYRLESTLQNYDIIRSTSKLIFSARIEYDKVIKYIIHDLDESGLIQVEPELIQHSRFRTFTLREDTKSIQVLSNANMAVFILFDLSVDETAFYVDLIGRFIAYRLPEIKMNIEDAKRIHSIDPVLYRYKGKPAYSRLCQKRFQPIISDANDPKAVQYHNFTFNRPQYYKCPDKKSPHLGFLSGPHPAGYCLPCCRKQYPGDQKKIIDQCISGKPLKEPQKELISARHYIIDYPSDTVSNERLITRLSNVPNTINKILTKGTKLLINGFSLDYPNTPIAMQIVVIIQQYLHKESTRDVLLLVLDYLKDQTNHKKILSMPAIQYAFTNIKDLINELNETFMRQGIIPREKNWNDILIDIFICMGIGIVLLVDNRLKSSDCANVANQQDDCSVEPSMSLNSSLKMEGLGYADLNNPVLLILKRIDTEYSRVNRNRQYYYFPIIPSDMIEPSVVSALPGTIQQLAKIKNITEAPITNIVNKSFDYNALIALSNKQIQIKALYNDVNQNIAYAEVLYKSTKTMLISLYRTASTPNEHTLANFQRSKYTADISAAIALIEIHNTNQLQSIDLRGFYENLKINLDVFKSGNVPSLPSAEKYLLKVGKFIVYNKFVIGIKIDAVDGKQIAHTIIIYINPTTISNAIAVLKTHQAKINSYKKESLTINDASLIVVMGLDLAQRSQSIVYSNLELRGSAFDKYFSEYLQDPISLIDVAPIAINFPQTEVLSRGQYFSSIYRLMVNRFITEWNQSQPTELIEAIIKLVQSVKPKVLATMSNNLIEDWIDKLIEQFGSTYHPNIIRVEFLDLIEYIQLNIRHKTKDAIIKALMATSLPINDIELHNLAYTDRTSIETLVRDTAAICLQQTSTIPTTDSYTNESGKLLILKSLYADLISLAVSDLSNQFRREFILSNCLMSTFDNRPKLKSQMNELIYIQEL